MIMQGEFFIFKYRNISRNTHRTKKISTIESFYFRVRKATTQTFSPQLEGALKFQI